MRASANMVVRCAVWTGVGLMVGLAGSPPAIRAAGGPQQGRNTQPVMPVQPSLPDSTIHRDEEPSANDRLETMRQKVFVDERRKKIVADTDRLLQLATELKSEVTVTTKNELSIGVIKKAGDIEKLAHDVKERMRQ